jgi:two-component system, sensor histidine kinase and response regulator
MRKKKKSKEKLLEELTRFHKAEPVYNSQKRMLDMMSEEIRSAFSMIIRMNRLLMATSQSQEQREYSEMIRTSADSLMTVVTDLLDYLKIEAGIMELGTLDFDLRNTVQDIVHALTAQVEEKGLVMGCLIHHDVPSLLRGDPGRLRQILRNLIVNALQFTVQGEVGLQVSLEEEKEVQVKLRFDVIDTGNGIPPEQREVLFHPFHQGDVSIPHKDRGNGLGLAISKKLAEMMGGEIGVESEEGKGSTFWFTAVFAKQPTGGKRPVISPENFSGQRVLVVDDQETTRSILMKDLNSWGFRPEEAAKGPEALDKLRKAHTIKDPFAIAILSREMMETDGTMLGRQIKEDPDLKDTLLVLLTTQGRRGDGKLMQDIGFAAYFPGPLRSAQLRSALVRALEKKAAHLDPATPLITRHFLVEEKKREIRILLAEESMINRKAVMRTLEKLGLRADVVSKAKEALASLEATVFDLILIDGQMAEKNSSSLSAAIRQKEWETGRHIPMIALTRQPPKYDREEIWEGGADDYVTKPIQPWELIMAIERQLEGILVGNPSLDIFAEAEDKDVFDPSELRQRLAGDEVLFRDMIKTFQEGAPVQFEKLKRSLKEGDAAQVELRAHTLKGIAMNIGGKDLQRVARQMEAAARNRDLPQAKKLVEKLDWEFVRLGKALANL